MSGSETAREDRQLPATEKRLRQAAEEGNVARSRDAAHVIVLGGGIGTLLVAGGAIREDLTRLLRAVLAFDQSVRVDSQQPFERLLAPLVEASALVGILLGAAVLAAIAAAAVPGGIGFAAKALGVKPERLSPLAGLKRI